MSSGNGVQPLLAISVANSEQFQREWDEEEEWRDWDEEAGWRAHEDALMERIELETYFKYCATFLSS